MSGGYRKVYVTGAAGMIGSNICRSLLEDGAAVIGVDNFWRGSQRVVTELENHPNFSFRYADIISDCDWYRDMDDESVLLHTADIVAGIGYVFANEWNVFQKNVLINTHIARVINEKQPARLVYLGTACSYPQHLQRSVESSVLSEAVKLPADPESGYGWSKLMGEIEFRLAIKEAPTQITVLDLHNVYGWPCIYRDSTAQVVPSLIYKALCNKDGELTVWGNGQQGRAFIHVDDVVSAVRLSLKYSGDETTFMIGPDRCTTIAEVARLIQAHPRIHISKIVFDTTKPTGDIGRFADAGLAQKELGWMPVIDFDVGLRNLVDRIIDDAG